MYIIPFLDPTSVWDIGDGPLIKANVRSLPIWIWIVDSRLVKLLTFKGRCGVILFHGIGRSLWIEITFFTLC